MAPGQCRQKPRSRSCLPAAAKSASGEGHQESGIHAGPSLAVAVAVKARQILARLGKAESCRLCLSLMMSSLTQHEVGVRNLEILNATTDARGRKLEVVKVHCPPPLFRTYREAEGVDVSPPSLCPNCCAGFPCSTCGSALNSE